MKTTSTIRKLRTLLLDLRDGKLNPSPHFQRRLVWTNIDKLNFLVTVLQGYPFPEIYVASGELDPDTAEGTELLVDGQQRLTTLNQYFIGSDELRLGKQITPYDKLPPDQQREFLQYDVVVRDLGLISDKDIVEVFQRINSTGYSLNAMEIRNSRFNGRLKKAAEAIAKYDFFERHRIFSINDIRRMNDSRYILTVLVTVMSGYFHRDDELEEYLERYNEEFPDQPQLMSRIGGILKEIDSFNFHEKSRAWKSSDLFTLVVELYHFHYQSTNQSIMRRETSVIAEDLRQFYYEVDRRFKKEDLRFPWADLEKYSLAALQAANDRSNRITRGEIIQSVITGKYQSNISNK
jgi:hypothetical protein